MSAILEELLRFDVYKRSQGRIVRQVTFAAIAITILVGLWQLLFSLKGSENIAASIVYGVPGALAVVGLWVTYRAVNLPLFADFLIAVEAEMNKVSWPSWSELVRWSMVVIIMIFSVGFLLFGFDALWVKIFTLINLYHGANG